VEFRPFDEVEASMESLGTLPGVLLHPEQNYGTDFGDGAYPVRGCTAEGVAWADDQIHTQGKLIVWDAEWNAAIASSEVVELSAGYTIDFDPTPGQAPKDAPGVDEFGRDYVGVQRAIIGDHMAGVPEGNAGTARVILDAKRSSVLPATRKLLLDVAAARRDAATIYFDMARKAGPRPTRDQDQPMSKAEQLEAKLDELRKAGKLTPQAKLDAWVDVYGESNDPDMKRALSALASDEGEAAPAAAGPAPVADEEPDEEPDEEGEAPPENNGESDQEEEPEEDEESAASKQDAAKARADRAINYAEAAIAARAVFGPSFGLRHDDGTAKTVGELRSAVVGKLDSAELTAVRNLDRRDQASGLRLAFARCQRQIHDHQMRAPIENLLEQINSTRADARTETGEELAETAKRIDALHSNAANANAQRRI
jgi:hypothetical protein